MNLLDITIQKEFVTCRLGSAAGRLIGVYRSVAEASDDLLIDTAVIEGALSDGIMQNADTPRFWSRETVLSLSPVSGSVPSAFLTRFAEFYSLALPLRARQQERRGGHSHPDTSTPVVALHRDTQALAERYRSIYEASRATGARNITKCCRREAKTSGGYMWMYAADYDNLQKQ